MKIITNNKNSIRKTIGIVLTIMLCMSVIPFFVFIVFHDSIISNVGIVGASPSFEGGFFWIEPPIDITISQVGSWQDIDLSPYIPNGTTGAIILHVSDGLNDSQCARGTEDTNNYMDIDLYCEIEVKTYRNQIVKVDSNRKIQGYMEDISNKIWLVGYTLGSDPVFRAVPESISQKGGAYWQNYTAPNVAGDTTGVILFIQSLSSKDRHVEVRAVGSTNTQYYREWEEFDFGVWAVKIDANDNFQMRFAQGALFRIYLVAETKDSIQYEVNYTQIPDPSLGSWQDRYLNDYVTPPADCSGVFLRGINTAADAITKALRPNGSSFDPLADSEITYDLQYYLWTGVDSGNIFEYYLTSTAVDFYIEAMTRGGLPAPETPILLQPDNGDSTVDVTPTFDWTDTDYAENYRIEVDDEPTFSTPLVDNVSDIMSSYWEKTGDGYSGGIYYWRVWGVNEGNQTVSDNLFNFTIVDWWNDNWLYRRAVEFSAYPDNYQYKIFLDNSINISENFADIRFIETAVENQLPYWIENYVYSDDDNALNDNALVRVRRPENDDNQIYYYYGNPSVTSDDNYDNTMTKDFGESGLMLLFHMDEGIAENVYIYDDPSAGGDDNGTVNETGDGVQWRQVDGGQWDNRDVTFSAGDSLDFAGSDDYITVPSSASLDIDGSFTIEVWAKFDVVGEKTIAEKRSGDDGFRFGANGSSQPWFFVSDTSFGSYIATSPNAITTGEWYHLVGSFDDDNKQVSIYVDAVLENYQINTDGLESPATELYIGCDINEDKDFNGQLDELRIYNRCLTDAEIFSHYERRRFTSPEPVATIFAQEPYPGLPTKPVLYKPENNSTIYDDTPEFEWTLPDNYDSQKIRISTDSIFDNIAFEDNNIEIGDNDFVLPPENWLSDGKYWWDVSAHNENGDNESAPFNFTLKGVSIFEDSAGVEEVWRYENSSHGEIFRVAMDDDGERIAIITDSDGILMYFMSDDNEWEWSRDEGDSGQNVAMDDDGMLIVIAYSETGTNIYAYNENGVEQWTHQHPTKVVKDTVDVSSDGKIVSAGSGYNTDSYIEILDGDTGNERWELYLGGSEARVRNISISDNIDGNYRIASISSDDYLRVFYDDSNDVRCSYYFENAGYFPTSATSISESGDYVIVAARDNFVYLFWENADGTAGWGENDNAYMWRWEFTDNRYFLDQHVWHIADISDDGEYMIAGINSGEGGVVVWDKDSGTPLWEWHGLEARDVKVSGDGTRFTYAGWSGRFATWAKDDNEFVWWFGDIGQRPDDTAISEDGSILAGAAPQALYYLKDGSFAYNLKVEEQERPLQVLTSTPGFSFSLPSRRVENTVKYRIQVGENSTSWEMWNAEWNIGEENEVYREYSGSSLSLYKTYYWRVRLKDNEGNWSPWSVSRTFQLVGLYDFTYYRSLSFPMENILDNYQVRVEIDNAENMDENFIDIIFYDSNYPDVGLPYYLENITAGSAAKAWVKIHDNENIKMCYGNDNAENASYGDDVFILFDNFDVLDTKKWSVYKVSVSGGELVLSGSGSKFVWSKEMYSDGISFRARAKLDDTVDYLFIGFSKHGELPVQYPNYQVPGAFFWGRNTSLTLRTGGATYQSGGAPSTDNSNTVGYLGSYTTYEVKKIGIDSVELWANDDNLVAVNYTNLPEDTPTPATIFNDKASAAGEIRVDWAFLRKTIAGETIATIGSQKTNTELKLTNLWMDTPISPEENYDITIEFSDANTLASINKIELILYENFVTDDDDTRYKYTFEWTQTGEGWETEQLDTTAPYMTSITLDENGNPHIIWKTSLGGGYYRVKYASFNGSWTIENVYDYASYGGTQTSALVLDNQGRAHITTYGKYGSPPPYNFVYIWENDDGWQSENIDAWANDSFQSGIALDENQNPHVVYRSNDSPKNLVYAYKNNGAWTKENVSDNFRLGNCSIALDENQHPHIACDWRPIYAANDNSWIRYAYHDGTSWSIEDVDNGNTYTGEYGATIALDSNWKPHIVYTWDNLEEDLDVRYASKTGAVWVVEEVEATQEEVQEFSDIAIDANDIPHVTYDSDDWLMYAYKSGGSWIIENTNLSGTITFMSIDVDSSGMPHISHRDGTDMFYTKKTSAFGGFVEVGPGGGLVAGSPNTVGTTTTAVSIRIPTQRQTVYASGLRWAFYIEPENIMYRTSVDGISWSAVDNMRSIPSGSDADDFSICIDGSYLHYAYTPTTIGSALSYRMGLLNSDGTITWQADENIIYENANVYPYDPTICVDSSGYPVVSYFLFYSGSSHPYIEKSSKKDGTWENASGFPYELSSSVGAYVLVVPLTDNKLYAFWNYLDYLKGKLYDGSSWGSEEAIPSSGKIIDDMNYSGIGVDNTDNTVYVCGFRNGTISFVKRTYGSGWGSAETVQDSLSNTSISVLSIDTATGDLYCFWINESHVYYKKRSNGIWDSSATDWIDETTDTIPSNDRLSSYYQDYGDKIGLIYLTGASSPWNVRYAEFSLAYNEHLIVENCVAGDSASTLDNWVFEVKLGGVAKPANWNIQVKAYREADHIENLFIDNFAINNYFSMDQSTDTIRFGGYAGSENNASYENPVTLTITTNYNFNLTVKTTGDFTNENENLWFENEDGESSRFKLTTTAQTSYSNVSWGKDIEKLEYYFIDIPIEIGPGKYYTDFYTDYEEI